MVVRIVTDSACDLPQARADELGIEIVPLTIRFGDEEFVDRVELTNEEFWRKVATSPAPPRDCGASPGAFEERFRALAADGADGIVCINLSSRLSGTMQSAQIAAKALEGEFPVRVVDSLSVSMGLGRQCIAAQALAAAGADLDTIAAAVERPGPDHPTLRRPRHPRAPSPRGRIGGAQAMLGGMLSIKPIIEIPRRRRRSRPARSGPAARASSTSRSKLAGATNPTGVFVFHAQAPDIEEFLDLLSAIASS